MRLAAALLLASVATVARADETVPGAGFDVTRYDLSLTPDLAAKAVAGRERISFRSLDTGLAELAFTANALVIERALLDGRSVRFGTRGKALVFILPKPIARGRTAVLDIIYRGTPARGLIFSDRSVYSSYFACDWMICAQDTPGDKARFTLDLAVPQGMVSLGPGQRIDDRSRRHLWALARPYSPYLFGFAMGDFAQASVTRDGTTLSVFGSTTSAPHFARLIDETATIIRFYAARAGTPLPDGRYAQLLVPGSEAQEAASYSALGEDQLAAEWLDPPASWAIAHELAHQWWGNLVTCASFTDFWLNEGITTFMTAAWKEQKYGRGAYEAELAIARKRLGRARDAGWDRPLAFAGPYPSLGTRRAIQYSKGALFMDRLRTELGERAFWAGLKGYTRGHAGGTVVSKDFQTAMERASKRDLSGLFAEWVYGA